MSWPQIREQLAAILAAVEGAGVIHQYQRWSGTWEKFLDLYKFDGAINGGSISRTKKEEASGEEDDSSSHQLVRHHIAIRYYRGLQDSSGSEIANDAFIDAVCAAVRAAYRLNGTCYHNSALQVPVSEPRMFGGVLCHYAEMTLFAEEWQAWA